MVHLVNCLFIGVDPGLIGLSMAYSISLADMCQYGMRMSTEVENLVRLANLYLGSHTSACPHTCTDLHSSSTSVSILDDFH